MMAVSNRGGGAVAALLRGTVKRELLCPLPLNACVQLQSESNEPHMQDRLPPARTAREQPSQYTQHHGVSTPTLLLQLRAHPLRLRPNHLSHPPCRPSLA